MGGWVGVDMRGARFDIFHTQPGGHVAPVHQSASTQVYRNTQLGGHVAPTNTYSLCTVQCKIIKFSYLAGPGGVSGSMYLLCTLKVCSAYCSIQQRNNAHHTSKTKPSGRHVRPHQDHFRAHKCNTFCISVHCTGEVCTMHIV